MAPSVSRKRHGEKFEFLVLDFQKYQALGWRVAARLPASELLGGLVISRDASRGEEDQVSNVHRLEPFTTAQMEDD
jgi:ribosome maturation protein Sdo1